MKTDIETQSMFEAFGAPSAGSMLKSLGIHVFMLGLLLILSAQALLHNAPREKNVDVDIVFYRAPEIAIAVPAPTIPAPAVKIAAGPSPVAPAPSKPRPNVTDRPAPANPELPPTPPPGPRAETQPQPTVARAGILAFKDQFANVAQNKTAPRLGAEAHYVEANDAGQPSSRSMLTANSRGSSGGIDAASLNRSVSNSGGGSSNGGIPGVPLTRATSTIASVAADDRPKPRSEPAGSRTDEEIQIVFDRYKAAFYRLYTRTLRNDPALKGQMVLRLTIEPDGSVSMCKLQSSDMKAPDLADQVMNITQTINFGARGGPAVTIVYPIDFLPAA